MTQRQQPIHRCALCLTRQGVTTRRHLDPDTKTRPAVNHCSWQRPKKPGTTAAAQVVVHRNKARQGPRRGTRAACQSPAPFPQLPPSRELTHLSMVVSRLHCIACKSQGRQRCLAMYQRQEKGKCVSACDSASCSPNGGKLASPRVLMFGTPRQRHLRKGRRELRVR